MTSYIKGNFKKIIFSSENGYIIGLLKISDTNDINLYDYVDKSITITGYFDKIYENNLYMMYGELINHPKYGKQYQVSNYEKLKPEGKEGIIEFLSSDLFPGIGNKMATKIVEKLGENALELILENPNSLLIVKGLTTQKRNLISETLINYENSHKTIVYLNEIGFSMKESLAIYNKYKENTIMQIENNIYNIVNDIEDIPFNKIDEIALNWNIEFLDEKRVKALILYLIKKMTFDKGDTYFLFDEIYEELVSFLNSRIEYEIVNQYLEELYYEEKIIIENEKIYLKEFYLKEKYISERLKKINNKSLKKETDYLIKLEQLEKINNIKYDDMQKEAILEALNNNITIITGGPGTGKTTIVNAIVSIYQMANNYSDEEMLSYVALLAPTGRASKRLGDSTNFRATTIHRFLKWNKDNNTFAINEFNKNYSKLIIIDEVSMLDILIFENLLKGLTNNIKLIFVGDINQLPSVGPGQVLKDLISSNLFKTVYLNLLYRQNVNSYINTLAYEIKENKLTDYLTVKDDYMFLNCNNANIKNNLKKICDQLISKKYDIKDFQVMAPMYYGDSGIDSLNLELQNIFNPSSINKKEIKYGNIIYRENDKVLVLSNFPELNIFNGDIGIIKKIIDSKESESKKHEIYIDFYGNVVKFSLKDFNQIKHGYVISIHKSQGSEFDTVILILSNSHKRMLYRKIVYTAVTRAKRKLILIGQKEAFEYAVYNNNEYVRKTTLLENLLKSE